MRLSRALRPLAVLSVVALFAACGSGPTGLGAQDGQIELGRICEKAA